MGSIFIPDIYHLLPVLDTLENISFMLMGVSEKLRESHVSSRPWFAGHFLDDQRQPSAGQAERGRRPAVKTFSKKTHNFSSTTCRFNCETNWLMTMQLIAFLVTPTSWIKCRLEFSWYQRIDLRHEFEESRVHSNGYRGQTCPNLLISKINLIWLHYRTHDIEYD